MAMSPYRPVLRFTVVEHKLQREKVENLSGSINDGGSRFCAMANELEALALHRRQAARHRSTHDHQLSQQGRTRGRYRLPVLARDKHVLAAHYVPARKTAQPAA